MSAASCCACTRVLVGASGGDLLDVLVCLIDGSAAESQEPQSSLGPLEFLQQRQE